LGCRVPPHVFGNIGWRRGVVTGRLNEGGVMVYRIEWVADEDDEPDTLLVAYKPSFGHRGRLVLVEPDYEAAQAQRDVGTAIDYISTKAIVDAALKGDT
jgi:hypothetical protein